VSKGEGLQGLEKENLKEKDFRDLKRRT